MNIKHVSSIFRGYILVETFALCFGRFRDSTQYLSLKQLTELIDLSQRPVGRTDGSKILNNRQKADGLKLKK